MNETTYIVSDIPDFDAPVPITAESHVQAAELAHKEEEDHLCDPEDLITWHVKDTDTGEVKQVEVAKMFVGCLKELPSHPGDRPCYVALDRDGGLVGVQSTEFFGHHAIMTLVAWMAAGYRINHCERDEWIKLMDQWKKANPKEETDE